MKPLSFHKGQNMLLKLDEIKKMHLYLSISPVNINFLVAPHRLYSVANYVKIRIYRRQDHSEIN